MNTLGISETNLDTACINLIAKLIFFLFKQARVIIKIPIKTEHIPIIKQIIFALFYPLIYS